MALKRRSRAARPIAALLLICSGSSLRAESALDEGRLDAFVETALQAYSVPGCAVGVVEGSEIILTKGYGVADVETGRTVDARTIFQIESATKTFTASAILQLKERGLIQLDDPVVKHVPYFSLHDDRYPAITIRMLLNHTSGVPTMYKAEFGYERPELDDLALRRHIEGLSGLGMEFAPGEKHKYSNHGYAILAAVIENVSRMPFEEYVRRNLLEPVGMRRSTFSLAQLDRENFAAPHILGKDLGPAVSSIEPYNRWAASSGGLYSSAEDLARWTLVSLAKGQGLNRILAKTSYEEMWTVSSDKSERMGLGWFLDETSLGPLISHPGGGLGYSAELCLFPEKGLGVVVLCNSRRSPAWEIVKAVAYLMQGKESPEVSPGLETLLLDRIKKEGIDAAIGTYRKMRVESPAEDFSATELLVLGHRLLNSRHPEREQLARRIFELAVEYFPDEAHTYDFLAEAYLALALKNYRKAVALDSSNWGAARIIRKLESM